MPEADLENHLSLLLAHARGEEGVLLVDVLLRFRTVALGVTYRSMGSASLQGKCRILHRSKRKSSRISRMAPGKMSHLILQPGGKLPITPGCTLTFYYDVSNLQSLLPAPWGAFLFDAPLLWSLKKLPRG